MSHDYEEEMALSTRREGRTQLGDNLKAKRVGEAEFDSVYSDDAQFGRIQFWDQRYVDFPEPFEWYYGYMHFQVLPLICMHFVYERAFFCK
jgi:hypothetical protein